MAEVQTQDPRPDSNFIQHPQVTAVEAREALVTLISYLDAYPPIDTDVDYISTLGMLLNHIDQKLMNTTGTSIVYIVQEPSDNNTYLKQEDGTLVLQESDMENIIHISSEDLNSIRAIGTDEVDAVESCLQTALSVHEESHLIVNDTVETSLSQSVVNTIVENVYVQENHFSDNIVDLLSSDKGISVEKNNLYCSDYHDEINSNTPSQNSKLQESDFYMRGNDDLVQEHRQNETPICKTSETNENDKIRTEIVNVNTVKDECTEVNKIKQDVSLMKSHVQQFVTNSSKYKMTTRSTSIKEETNITIDDDEIHNIQSKQENEEVSGIDNSYMSNKHTKKELTCEDCGKVFNGVGPLNKHKICHGPKKWKCTVCDKSYKGLANFNKHMISLGHGEVELKTQKREAQHACVDCGKLFDSLGQYNKHRKCHGPKDLKCPKCDKYFARKHNLNIHLKIHKGERPHVCEICDKRFLLKTNLNTHRETHVDGKNYSCEVCGKKFKLFSSVKIHMGLHNGNTKFMCDWCGKCYLTSSHLKEHIRSKHEGQKYECKECGKEYACRSAYTLHQRLHSDDTPYKCPICEVSFKAKPQLNYHLMKHQGERKFECDTCGKRYHTAGNLKSHEKIHSGVKPHSCSICKKSFTHAYDRKKHELTHGRELKNKCLVCDRYFKTTSQLRFHAKSHKLKISNDPISIDNVENYIFLAEVIIP